MCNHSYSSAFLKRNVSQLEMTAECRVLSLEIWFHAPVLEHWSWMSWLLWERAELEFTRSHCAHSAHSLGVLRTEERRLLGLDGWHWNHSQWGASFSLHLVLRLVTHVPESDIHCYLLGTRVCRVELLSFSALCEHKDNWFTSLGPGKDNSHQVSIHPEKDGVTFSPFLGTEG